MAINLKQIANNTYDKLDMNQSANRVDLFQQVFFNFYLLTIWPSRFASQKFSYVAILRSRDKSESNSLCTATFLFVGRGRLYTG